MEAVKQFAGIARTAALRTAEGHTAGRTGATQESLNCINIIIVLVGETLVTYAGSSIERKLGRASPPAWWA